VTSPRLCPAWLIVYGQGLLMINLPTKFEFLISSHCEDMKGIQNVENGVVWGSYGSFKVSGNSTI